MVALKVRQIRNCPGAHETLAIHSPPTVVPGFVSLNACGAKPDHHALIAKVVGDRSGVRGILDAYN
jgi:hypothetical protein